MKDLQKCVVFIKQTWLLAKSTQSYSRFDAVNTKYDSQKVLNLRSIWPPSVTQSSLQNWIYEKETLAEEEQLAEPMNID